MPSEEKVAKFARAEKQTKDKAPSPSQRRRRRKSKGSAKPKPDRKDPMTVSGLAASDPAIGNLSSEQQQQQQRKKLKETPSLKTLYATESLPHQLIHSTFAPRPTDTPLEAQARRFYRESIFIDGKSKLKPFPRELANCPITTDVRANVAKKPNSSHLIPIHRYEALLPLH